ncbi:hypothetical protein V2J09_001946 [Rumex salicifolius]
MGRRLPVAALLLLLCSMGVLSQACKEAERTALLKVSPQFMGGGRLLLLGRSVAQNLGNLTKLVALDLSTGGSLETDSLEWASKLKNLQYLDLSFMDLSQALDALNNIHHLPSLSVMNLAHCGLGNSHLVGMTNTTLSSTNTLQHLNLSHNNFIGTIPSFIQSFVIFHLIIVLQFHHGWEAKWTQMPKSWIQSLNDPLIPNLLQNLSLLTHLDLSTNQFSSSILSALVNKEEVTFLSLQDNHLTGPFPRFVQNMSFLKSLDLSSNQFSSSIPSWLGNNTYLEDLSLSNNLFNRVDRGVMNIISSLCDLTNLDLSYNQLQDNILEFDANFSRCSRYELSLQLLDLSQNNLEVIPASFGELFSLESVDLSYNKLSVLHQTNLANLSSLIDFDIRSNSLDLDISSDFQLETLRMPHCKINSQFPKWLVSQKSIAELDLSHTGLFGSLPINIGDAMQ